MSVCWGHSVRAGDAVGEGGGGVVLPHCHQRHRAAGFAHLVCERERDRKGKEEGGEKETERMCLLTQKGMFSEKSPK